MRVPSITSRERSRERMLAQWNRCVQGQANAHLISPPAVPLSEDTIPGGFVECIPEELMGNRAPLVPCDDPGDWT